MEHKERERTVAVSWSACEFNIAAIDLGPHCKERKLGPKLTKEQSDFCITLPKVFVQAENEGNVEDAKNIVATNFTKKCSGGFVDMLEAWHRFQPDNIRKCLKVRVMGTEITFTTLNTATCLLHSWDDAMSTLRSLNVVCDESAVFQDQMMNFKSTEQIVIVVTKSYFKWHFSVSSRRIIRWSVTHRLMDIKAAMLERPLSPDLFVTTIDCFPLLYCNARNSGDVGFVRQLVIKFGSPDIHFHVTSPILAIFGIGHSLSLDEHMIAWGKLIEAIPDHMRTLMEQRVVDGNSFVFTCVFKGTVIIVGGVTRVTQVPTYTTKRISLLMESTIHLDPISKSIFHYSAREIRAHVHPPHGAILECGNR